MLKEFKVNYELDQELINQKSKEFAEKALISELENYYTSYNSPFKKEIKEYLEKQEISIHFELPDILETMNKAIEKEHSSLVEKFINHSFVADMRDSLQLQPKEITFGDFLKKVMEANHNSYESDLHKYDVSVEDKLETTKEIVITYQTKEIEVIVQTFDKGKSYEFCRSPYKKRHDGSSYLSSIESYLLSLALSGTKIVEWDVESFEELFYED